MLKCASRRVLVQFAVLSVTRIFSESTLRFGNECIGRRP